MRRFGTFIVSSITLLLAGCSDDPGRVGVGLVSPQDTLKVYSIVVPATSDTTFVTRTAGVAALVGRFRNLEARSLLQFTGFSSIPSNATIDSAVVRMPLNYFYRDTAGIIAFSIHEMLESWTEAGFFWQNSDSSGSAYNSQPVGTVLATVQKSDTAITFRLDSLVRQWIRAGTNNPDGIILLPSLLYDSLIAGGRPDPLIDTRPLITVSYHDSADTAALTYSARTTQELTVANVPPPADLSGLTLQAGVAYRSLIRFDQFPLPPNASVTRATLRLVRNDALSVLTPTSHDSVLASLLMKNYYPYDSLALATICSPADSNGHHIYSGNVSRIVQQWLVHRPNEGIILRPYDEGLSFDRFALFGTAASEELRPTLIITYTLLP